MTRHRSPSPFPLSTMQPPRASRARSGLLRWRPRSRRHGRLVAVLEGAIGEPPATGGSKLMEPPAAERNETKTGGA